MDTCDPVKFLDMKLEKVTRRKKEIAAATYRYQADCDGEWGEIQFDFEKRKAKILHLADWDTSRTKLYAKRVAVSYAPAGTIFRRKRGKIVGILGVAFIGTVEIHASRTATTIRMQNTCIL